MQTFQMLLSQKQTFFSQFFSDIFECALNFEHFQKKKDDLHSLCMSEFTDHEARG